METGYNSPDTSRENKNLWHKAPEGENAQTNNDEEKKPNLAPDKSRDYKVLNNDGSLADLPTDNTAGSGALDGTVGLGT